MIKLIKTNFIFTILFLLGILFGIGFNAVYNSSYGVIKDVSFVLSDIGTVTMLISALIIVVINFILKYKI